MPRFNLATLTRRINPGIRRRVIVLRDIEPPAVRATDLYRSVYLPVSRLWEAAIPAILAEYARTLASMTMDSPADVQGQIEAGAISFQALVLRLAPELRDWAIGMETWYRDKWRSAVLSATGVDLKTFIGPEDVRETVETFIARNVALVKDVSAQAQGRISDAVYRGLTERKPAAEVAKELREVTDFARARSKRIASDQLSKLAAALSDERRREAGISTWKWRHSGKAHPRKWHRERDGNIYSEDAGMVGKTVEGQTVQAPPPADDQPGMPPFCGCRKQSVLLLD